MKNAFDAHGGNAELAGSVVVGVGKGQPSPLQVASDGDGVPDILGESARHGNGLQQSLLPLHLILSGVGDFTKNGDGLAMKLNHTDYRVRRLDYLRQTLVHLLPQTVGGQSGGVDAAGVGQCDIAAHVDSKGFVGEILFQLGYEDGD